MQQHDTYHNFIVKPDNKVFSKKMIDSEENTNKQRRGYSKGTTVKSVTMAVISINKNLQEKYQNTKTVQYISKDKKLPFTLAFCHDLNFALFDACFFKVQVTLNPGLTFRLTS